MRSNRVPVSRLLSSVGCLVMALAIGAPSPVQAGALTGAMRNAIAARSAQAAAARAAGVAMSKQAATGAVQRQAETVAITAAAARLAATAPARAAGPALASRPTDVLISRTRYPAAAAHIQHAQRHQPTILHIDRKGAAARRHASTGRIDPTRTPFKLADRDEYPPALTREGGHNANTRWIPRSDNRGAGAAMSAQTRKLPDGSRIRILVSE